VEILKGQMNPELRKISTTFIINRVNRQTFPCYDRMLDLAHRWESRPARYGPRLSLRRAFGELPKALYSCTPSGACPADSELLR
jgi:hypothetical protein